jgi:hypothetical protein
MIKILDIWVKSQTFSATSLERVQNVVDETGIEANPGSGVSQNNVKPETISTTPTGSPVQVKQNVKSETGNMVANATDTGEYQSWFCFVDVSGVDVRLRNMGLCWSGWNRRMGYLTPTWRSRVPFRFASIWLRSSLSTNRNPCRIVAGSQRATTGPTRSGGSRHPISGKRIVYSVATMLQIYIPKAVAIFLQPARIFVSSWQMAGIRRSRHCRQPCTARAHHRESDLYIWPTMWIETECRGPDLLDLGKTEVQVLRKAPEGAKRPSSEPVKSGARLEPHQQPRKPPGFSICAHTPTALESLTFDDVNPHDP